MVFCGIGSKACSSCRTRRIKCDQRSPACSQCLRAGKECSGYRDAISLMFRDENERVIDKAARKARSSKKTNEHRKSLPGPANSDVSPESTSSSSNDGVEKGEPISRPGSPFLASSALAEPGIKFFFENYVTVVSYLENNELDLASSLIWPELVQDKTFRNAASSMGFAGLSNVTKDPNFMVIAMQKYSLVIQDIKAALEDPSKADLAATFKSVMVLAAFEIVNCTSIATASWGIHIDGAQAIIKLRQDGHSGLPAPVRMQMQFIFSVLVKCASRGEAPKESLLVLNRQCKESMTVDDSYAASLVEIIYRVIKLYTKTKHPPQSTEQNEILQEAKLLDMELKMWEAHLPERWSFTTKVATDELAYTYNGQTYEYLDMWCARIYDNYRWARIMVNQLILVHMAKLGSSVSENTTPEWREASGVISQTATDVCRSVSSHLRRYSVMDAMRYAVPPLSGCFLILFSLALAGSAMEVSEELHGWAVDTLEIVGNRMGIAQALILIPLMKTQRENWRNGKEGFLLFGRFTGFNSAN